MKKMSINNQEEYHDFYIQGDTLLLADVFENFGSMCLKYMSVMLQNFFHLLDQHGSNFEKDKGIIRSFN